METNHISYNIDKSATRIDDILNASNSGFEELDEIPSRDKLTFTNGFYIKVGALFVDIRDSSDLTDEHKRPTLAKLYRSYISEVVAIINSYEDCKEIILWEIVFQLYLMLNINHKFNQCLIALQELIL